MANASSSSAEADITVLLVDEHAVTRVGLRTVLEGSAAGGAIRVVGECGGAEEALDLAAALRPRVAVVDLLAGTGAAGFGLIKDLRVRQGGETQTLVCSAALVAHTVEHLLAIGARGYVCKGEPPGRVVDAVRRVAAGRTYLDADTAADLAATLARPRRSPRPPPGDGDDDAANADALARRVATLSPGELEVLHMIGHGQTTASIAATQHRSVKTIETYRSRIKAKLGLKNPTEMAQWAWRWVHGVGVLANP